MERLACIASVPVRGEQKAAAGKVEGVKNGEGGGEGNPSSPSPSPAAAFCSPRAGTPAMQAKLVDEAMFTRCSSSLPGSFTRRAWERIPPIEGIF